MTANNTYGRAGDFTAAASSFLAMRDKRGIALMLPLPHQEAVIAAGRPLRIVVAGGRTRVVDATAPGAEVEKAADAAVDRVGLMFEHDLPAVDAGMAVEKRLHVELEILRQALGVALVDLDVVVAAAVGRALGAVVADSHSLPVYTVPPRWPPQHRTRPIAW